LTINKQQLQSLRTDIAGLKESKATLKEDVDVLADERRMSEKELLQIQNIQKVLKSRWTQPYYVPTIGIILCNLLT
jgi:septation ring formation regulator EzrA